MSELSESGFQVPEHVRQYLHDHGNDNARRAALGDKYAEVQRRVNELLSGTPNAPGTSTGVPRVIAGEYKVVASRPYVRSTPSRRLKAVASYVRGERIFDVAADTIEAEGHIWAHYVGASGMIRYVAMGTASGTERYLVKA